ncbi:hypothetical protein P0082_12325 [Candidatus Haliotispira prima]|uniref:Uncharacterized protein n=1 Tax=Candidatus Haliotispira prima TaxID=3034016 RepID=A0ABY8MH69_9SPIO|nr:hypothetical protein P0082_12325 [Candidatus Haliotispira prima]
MKKLGITLLLLLFAGVHGLVAQDAAPVEPVAEEEGALEVPAVEEPVAEEPAAESAQAESEPGTITVKITPSVFGQGRIHLAGDEDRKLQNPITRGTAEGRVKFEGDYNGIAGVNVELEGELNSASGQGDDSTQGTGSASANIGFGDNAYAYVHVLEAFGLDKGLFDIYLQSGRFEVGFDNAKEAGHDTWLADVDPLGRDNQINMQLDLKIMDMLTLRTGVSFSPIDSASQAYDLGFGLLFAKSFGDHKIEASVGYVANLTNNQGNDADGTPKAVSTVPGDFDDFGFSLAYTGSFGSIKLMPFFNVRVKGLIAKPRWSYVNSLIGWSAGLKFQLRDAGDGYDLLGLGVDLGGSVRENNNYTTAAKDAVEAKYTENAGFKGLGVKIWTDGLKAVMGDNYLSVNLKTRFDLYTPTDYVREGFLGAWSIGLEQYLVNVSDASVKLKAEIGMENLAPFTRDGLSGFYNASGTRQHAPFKTYFDLGLDASFTAKYTK